MPRKMLVFGPLAQVAIVVALLASALAFYRMGDRLQPGIIVGGVVAALGRLLVPVGRGRPGDLVKVVTRGTGKPPPPPPDA